MRKSQRAFTLVELAVVLLIIAVSVAIAFPSFSHGTLERVRMRSSVSRLADVAQYAYYRAVSTRLTHLLYLDTQQGSYWVVSKTPDGEQTPVTDGLELQGQFDLQ